MKINKNAAILELCRRIQMNENGVRGYLRTAGIQVAEKDSITIEHLNQMRTIDRNCFDEMILFLYPEAKQLSKPNADGEESSSSSKWSAGDFTNFFGTLIGGTSSILGQLNINGNTDAMANAEAYAAMAEYEKSEENKKQMRNTIIIVCAGFVILVIAGILIFKRNK